MPYLGLIKSSLSTYLWCRVAFVIGIFIFVFNSLLVPTAMGQLPEPEPERLTSIYSTSDIGNFAVGDVNLDGRELFALTAPTLKAEQQEVLSISPIQQRVQTVKSQLQKIAKTNFNAETLEVNYKVDSTTQLPIISVNGDYLMTVTRTDARLYGVDPTNHAQKLTGVIKNALLTYKREHQPEFLAQQALRAGGIILAILGLSLVICLRQRYIKSRHQIVLTQLEQLNASTEQLESFSEEEQSEAAERQQKIARKRG
ncbi:MAG: hypothetical protein HC899_34305 [Leptolyngbyaceae cyanobacterium SM1_4_3]|nr:hypothetical protein [Leptolyngbyaceae cyanobacterium SM1_4_3]